ncbi:helix-turn-helix transcriptional regulator [Phytobacter diazotrophicus]|uniref:XRE family transcriptional regulator n=1 Tax=Phytobacter diazotrophicus TaxID=395631 RepID=UPI00290F2D25|nr:helix-turn-helix transcriptional regulator [Phytobacter diazotrophicus]MDU6685333.1 helix-turn-helix transcriptional regulator [Enterobacteriaceae bacterium]
MKTFAERLNAAMNMASLSQAQLAERVGISQPAVQKMASGKTTGSRKMVEIARALNVRPEWLSAGIGAMKVSDDALPPENEWGTVDAWDKNTPLPADEVEVPFLKDIEFACGSGRVQEEDHNGFKLRFSKATLRRVGANTDGTGVLCFPAVGNSMEPLIPDGATVAINCNDKRIVDGKVYAVNQDGWKRLKMLYRVGPDRISLRSYNSQEHPDEEHALSEIEIIGRMFWSSMLW